jgi:predicted alpha/beta-fold hydrolase
MALDADRARSIKLNVLNLTAEPPLMKESLIKQLTRDSFVPHPAIKNAHAQTIISSLLRRRTELLNQNTEPRYFDPAPGVRLLAYCSWQSLPKESPTLITVHGLEGSSESGYMRGTAEKALKAGFNVLRLNMRNCGGTAHLTESLYHAGLTDDVRAIISELSESDGLKEIYLAGFSLGGNLSLKLAGEYGSTPPSALKGVVAVSPSIHLSSCADAIELGSNLIYQMSFVLSLKRSMRLKAELYPNRYDTLPLRNIRTIRQFDAAYVVPHCGFQDVNDYYTRASALPHISRITAPTMIIHAKDDPFIPYHPFEGYEITSNPRVLMIGTDRGGHVGFISAARAESEDRFWAETKIVEFIRALN